MKANAIYGLFKFSANQDRLKSLIEGRVYCNTPEYFRVHPAPGISDPHESVMFAYRDGRDGRDIEVIVGERPIRGVEAFTARRDGMKDRWIHSWSVLRAPPDLEGHRRVIASFKVLREHFGKHYVFMEPKHVEAFLSRVRAQTEHQVDFVEVVYSDDRRNWSPYCKASKYAYQREARLLVGECEEASLDPLVITVPRGFSDIMLLDPKVQMVNRKTGEEGVHMHGAELFEYPDWAVRDQPDT